MNVYVVRTTIENNGQEEICVWYVTASSMDNARYSFCDNMHLPYHFIGYNIINSNDDRHFELECIGAVYEGKVWMV